MIRKLALVAAAASLAIAVPSFAATTAEGPKADATVKTDKAVKSTKSEGRKAHKKAHRKARHAKEQIKADKPEAPLK